MNQNHRKPQRNLFAQAAEFLQWQDLPNATRARVQGLLAQLLLGALQAPIIINVEIGRSEQALASNQQSKGEDPCCQRSK